MKIAVCIKQVPLVSKIRFDNEARRLVREGVPNEISHFDMLALSAAVSIKQALSAEVVAYTMGPPAAREALVQCLAMGADMAVHLVGQGFAGSDTLATARALSSALRREEYDLVLCGRNSVDAETGQVGPEIAQILDLPQLTNVRRLEVDSTGQGVTAERLSDRGHDLVYCRLPALITVTEDVAPEIFAGKKAMDDVQSGHIVEFSPEDLSDDGGGFGMDGSPTWVSDIYSVEPDRAGIVVQGQPLEEAVTQLLDFLQKRGALDVQGGPKGGGAARGPRRRNGGRGAIWVVAELLNETVRPVTLELLGRSVELADELGTTVEAILIGDGIQSHVATLTAHGADRVYVADDPRVGHYDTEAYTTLVAEAIGRRRPYAVLIPSTIDGRDLAGRLAARLELGLTGDCVGLDIDGDGRLVQLKPAFGGNIVAPILSRTMPQMSTVRPGVLTAVVPDWSVVPEISRLPTDHLPTPAVRVLERVVDRSADSAELDHARVIVTVGKGVGGPENIPLVQRLAQALGGAIGATRRVTELGWLPRQYQIGLSGRAVAPDLYVAVGVRGAFNHMVGVRKAGTIVAINSSARSPIFASADFGIVGDYAEVVPAIISALEARSMAKAT